MRRLGKTNDLRRWKLVASLPMMAFILVSINPPAYALDDFKTFRGTDYVDVPNARGLQLGQFTIEVRFRVTEDSAERGYLVSKSSSGKTNSLLDQNYALFVTPQGRLVGGFNALDGSHNYLYSPVIAQDRWQLARLIYDGSALRLSIDDTVVSSLLVGKSPDNSATGDLRIGANANGSPAKFFVGDIDFVKIVDRSTFKQTYFKDFDEYSDSVNTDCSSIPMDQFKGAVFRDPVLGTMENGGDVDARWNSIDESMKYIRLNGMNLIRVPFYWESYVHDPAAFLDAVEVIAKTAEDHDICVIFANFHWYTTSYWKLEIIGNSDGRGFPSFVVKNFQPKNDDYDSTAAPFWNAFLTNSIVIDGKSVWDVQASFLSKIISQVDNYGSVAGYEILNEPHLFDSSQYEKLGNYHTYMAKKIRESTDKKILFDRETARGFQREPLSEYKIVPREVSGLVYSPHLYSVPVPGSNAEKQLSNFYQWADEWDVEILIGEWAAETQIDTELFLNGFIDRDFGWTYYAWKPTTDRGSGGELYQSDTSPPTIYLEYLVYALELIY